MQTLLRGGDRTARQPLIATRVSSRMAGVPERVRLDPAGWMFSVNDARASVFVAPSSV